MTKKGVKILLTAIFKDDSEIKDIERMLASFMPYCDGLCVALTGLSGEFTKLKKLIEKYKGIYIECDPITHPKLYAGGKGKSLFFANFAEARNVSFELAAQQEGYDWWTWADADDILVSGEQLREVAEKAKNSPNDYILFTYWYSIAFKEDNTFDQNCVKVHHLRERLIRPNKFKWISRLHEVAVPIDGNYQIKFATYDFNEELKQRCVWAHITDTERVKDTLERNVRILSIQVEEEQYKDPRTLFYLAKTYFDLETDEASIKCEELIQKYLELSGWEEERANAWEYLARLSIRKQDHKQAVERLHKALTEFPNHHMIILLLSKEYAQLGHEDKSHFWLETAINMEAPTARTTMGNPLEIKLMAASLKYNEHARRYAMAGRKDDFEGMIKWLGKRNELLGFDENEAMMKTLLEGKKLNEAGEMVFNYAKWLKDNKHNDKVPYLLKALPFELGREPFAHFIANEIGIGKKWPKNSIVYFASGGSEHFEEFSPKSVADGQGGSETAVVRLATEWAKLGYKVTVFCDPRENGGIVNGVDYRPWYEFNWNDEFNVLILWRSPHLLDRKIKARKLFMDVHDVQSQMDWTDDRMKKIDKVFFKSLYQRNMLPKLPDSKAEIVSNGI